MKPRTLILIALFLISHSMSACEDPHKQVLRSQMNDLEIERRILGENIAGRKSKVASLEQRVYEQQASLKEYEGKVQAYMMNHKMAIAAILAGVGGTAVAFDQNNEFSDDAQVVGGVVGAIALVWALANAEEVTEVADYMFQADARVKNLKKQSQDIQKDLESEKGLLQQEETELQTITTKITEIRSQL